MKEPNSMNDVTTAESALGQSWYDAEVRYRKETNRDSFTRILFVSRVESELNCFPHPIGHTGQKQKDLDHEGQEKLVNSSGAFLDLFQMEDILAKTITGCLVLTYESTNTNQGSALLGLLEAPPLVMYEIIRKIRDSTILHSARILLASEDCPTREFSDFGIFSANTIREPNIDILEEGGIKVVDYMLRSICEEAKNFPLKKNKVVEEISLIKELTGAQRKAIPTFTRVVACARSDFYASVEEFLQFFTDPITAKTEPDMVYPAEPTIRYDFDQEYTNLDPDSA